MASARVGRERRAASKHFSGKGSAMSQLGRRVSVSMGRLAVFAAAIVLVTALVTTRVVSEDKPKGPEMSPEMQKMMEMCAKAGQPGEQHTKMKELVGTWDAKTKMWMDPSAPPTEGKGTAKWRSIFDGRYVIVDWEGDSPMGPFQGMGISGYDNVAKKYVDIWLDSMSTGIMYSWGTADPSGKTITFEGAYHDPMTGKPKKVKSVTRHISETEMVFEMYDTTPEGKEYKNMEIVYHKK